MYELRRYREHLRPLLACLALAWLILHAAPAAACSPPVYPWFNEVLTFDKHALPPELSVTGPNDTGIKITAPGKSALSVVQVSGAEERIPSDYIQDPPMSKSQYLRMFSIYPDRFGQYLYGYNEQQRRGDGRPDDVAIPPTQHVTLTLRYNAETFSVPITLSYSLNVTYEPDAVKRFSDMCATHQAQSMTAAANAPRPTPIGGAPPSAAERAGTALLLVLGLGLWSAAGVLVWRWKRGGGRN